MKKIIFIVLAITLAACGGGQVVENAPEAFGSVSGGSLHCPGNASPMYTVAGISLEGIECTDDTVTLSTPAGSIVINTDVTTIAAPVLQVQNAPTIMECSLIVSNGGTMELGDQAVELTDVNPLSMTCTAKNTGVILNIIW